MQTTKLTPKLSVSGQISPGEIEELAAAGFRTIICNRPEQESADQPETETIRSAAADAGLEFIYQPVVSSSITEADVASFAGFYRNAAAPMLAFCRSGMRCTALWALANPDRLSVQDLLTAAANAGYDLSPLRGRLEQIAAAG